MPILQINFKLNAPVAEYAKICQALAQSIADVLAFDGRSGC